MIYTYEIKFFSNSFVVIESRQELKFGGLRRNQTIWTVTSFSDGCSESEIASWNRSREWLKAHHPELIL